MPRKKMLTLADVSSRVDDIKRASEANDYEAAHSLEDKLYHDLLKHLLTAEDLSKYGQLMIKTALKTKKLGFPRYTA